MDNYEKSLIFGEIPDGAPVALCEMGAVFTPGETEQRIFGTIPDEAPVALCEMGAIFAQPQVGNISERDNARKLG